MVFQLLISTSQKIGLPPALITADKQETIVNDGKITSSSSFRLSDSSARSKATDPFETATAYSLLNLSLNLFSNLQHRNLFQIFASLKVH